MRDRQNVGEFSKLSLTKRSPKGKRENELYLSKEFTYRPQRLKSVLKLVNIGVYRFSSVFNGTSIGIGNGFPSVFIGSQSVLIGFFEAGFPKMKI